MSGPATSAGVAVAAPPEPVSENGAVEISASRSAEVGAFRVRRALPQRERRSIGSWCFVDHFGPAAVSEDRGLDIGPHPHIGLQTVTWLLAGEVLHRDSLGSEQVIRPGQLNLMTAGHGVAHSEEATGHYRGELHGVQLWVAQPGTTRDGPPAFEHHAELPRVEFPSANATVLVGDWAGASSPARRDTDHLGVDLDLGPGTTVVPVRPDHEHGLVVCTGALTVDGTRVEPGQLAYLGCGRDERTLVVTERARALLIGGVPRETPLLMWWNYVARTRDEISVAHQAWLDDDGRFGTVASDLPRITVGPPPWTRP
jgi:redox-sensitive bicupin YhaK (pirin superfamily)